MRGPRAATPAAPSLRYADHDEADAFLTVEPLALLIGMVLDQQQPIERAFKAPLDLVHRLGREAVIGALDAHELASFAPDALAALFAVPPALHRFPRSMAQRTQELCRHLVTHYDGRAADVWQTATTGEDLLERVRRLPGFGEHKAKIFVALVGKRLGAGPAGWEAAAGEFGGPGTLLSVADIDGPEAKARVREAKKAKKAAAAAAALSPGVVPGRQARPARAVDGL